MRITRSLLMILAIAPAPLTAQGVVPSTAPIRIPDLGWLGPVMASAQSKIALGMAHSGMVAAQVSPAMAQARAGLLRAQAALTATGHRLTVGMYGLARQREEQSPPEAWAQQDPADQLYRDARAALNRQRYSNAADLFGQIYAKYPRSTYAGDAYYWQAYSLSKRSGDEALQRALDILRLQEEKAPNASTRSDARALATRIQGELARGGNEDMAVRIARTAATATAPPVPPVPATPPRRQGKTHCEGDEDIQTMALNALQQMDASRALPILRKVLARRDEGSECLRRKAMFIISQQEGPETERILLEAARSDPDPEVREQAVFWLSQVDSPGAVSALDSILRSANDPALQDKAIFALSQQDSPKARQALRDFALRASVSDDLREKAIFWIGQGDDPDRLDFLKTLYGQLKSEALKDKILFSISQIDGRASAQWLLSVASDVNEDIELRKKALFWVGQSDYPMAELSTLYDRMPSHEMKDQLIFVYSQRSEKSALDRLIQIARTEKDLELRKKAIFWLGQSDDPRAVEFLASLLEKP